MLLSTPPNSPCDDDKRMDFKGFAFNGVQGRSEPDGSDGAKRSWKGLRRESSWPSLPLPMRYPHPVPPAPGEVIEVAPGILWLRLALPFQLNHVNLYLVEDGDGYAVIDTGLGDAATTARWEALLVGMLRQRPLTRIIGTHYHPDHVGMAGWLCERLGVTLLMSEVEYLHARLLTVDTGHTVDGPHRDFYRDGGLDEETTRLLVSDGRRYLRLVTGLPQRYRSIAAGETLRLGGRQFEVLTGGGHSPDQVMLHCVAENILLCADQVLARISPNISVFAMNPEGDPLGNYLASLAALRRGVPDGTLLLPGHERPFIGLHERLDELTAHHEARCAAVLDACSTGDHSVAELVPVVFGRRIGDPHQMGFAFGEAMAHVNLLVRRERLRAVGPRFRSVRGEGSDLNPSRPEISST